MLKDEIKILSSEESELLKADKLSKKRMNRTGLYLLCESEKYEAYDYGERQAWAEYFGSYENAPTGWCQEFTNPLDAIDWLLCQKK